MPPKFRYRPLWRRSPWVLAGVLLAYLLPWVGVKALVTGACVTACEFLGLQAVRLSPTTFVMQGMPLVIDTGCSMIDVYLGSLALLWCVGRSWLWNLGVLAAAFPLLMAINIVRLVSGFWAIKHGASWLWAHEVAGGLVYWLILEGLCQWRAVQDSPMRSGSGV